VKHIFTKQLQKRSRGVKRESARRIGKRRLPCEWLSMQRTSNVTAWVVEAGVGGELVGRGWRTLRRSSPHARISVEWCASA
jgi:hypothetical protein